MLWVPLCFNRVCYLLCWLDNVSITLAFILASLFMSRDLGLPWRDKQYAEVSECANIRISNKNFCECLICSRLVSVRRAILVLLNFLKTYMSFAVCDSLFPCNYHYYGVLMLMMEVYSSLRCVALGKNLNCWLLINI